VRDFWLRASAAVGEAVSTRNMVFAVIRRQRKKIPMKGANSEISRDIVYFSVPYEAAAQGVDPPQHELRARPPILSRLVATIEKLGRFLAGQKI
jgi:hypothetical protein